MSIKYKTMILVLVILVATVSGLYPIVSRVLLDGFSRLEDQDAINNSQRLKAAFTDQYAELTMKAKDWAYWDDAHDFIQRKQTAADFVKVNFIDSQFEDIQLNLIAYLDLDGRLVYGREYDPAQKKQILPSEELTRLLARKEIWQHRAPSDILSGMTLLPKGPFLFAAVPVTHSRVKPPHVGTAVLGRYFDLSRMKALAEKTRLNCTFTQNPAEVAGPEYRLFMQSWRQTPQILLRPNETTISAISSISDYENRCALFYQVNLPRNIYGEARRSLAVTLRILVFAGAALGAIIYVLLHRLVVCRIQGIHNHLKKNMETNDYDSLLHVRTTDEISKLAESINGLLAAESTIMHSVPESGKTETQ